jgi:GNAT superfamily N-acetyltransferase
LDLSQWARRAALLRQERGFRGLLSRAFSYMLEAQPIYRRALLFERILSEPIPEISARPPVVFDLLEETGVGEYINFRPDADAQKIRSRLKCGDRCFVASREGQIVGAIWTSTSYASLDYLGRRIPLAPDEAFTYDSFTLPHLRGQDIHTALEVRILRYFRDAGVLRMVSYILQNNKASIRAQQKCGYRPVAVMGYVGLGPWRRDFLIPDQTTKCQRLSAQDYRSFPRASRYACN